MKDFDKIIEKSFSSFAQLRGFTQKKGLFWCSVNDGLIKAIGFNKTPVKYEALYFVQPLFDYQDCWVLEYGDTLLRRYPKKPKKLMLYRDFDELLINNNLENIKLCLEKDVLARMSSICDATSLLNVINGDLFFCRPVNRLRMAAYASLYSKKYEEAIILFNQYIEMEIKYGYCFEERISEPQKLLDIMKNDTESAYSVLVNNVDKSRKKLKV